MNPQTARHSPLHQIATRQRSGTCATCGESHVNTKTPRTIEAYVDAWDLGHRYHKSTPLHVHMVSVWQARRPGVNVSYTLRSRYLAGCGSARLLPTWRQTSLHGRSLVQRTAAAGKGSSGEIWVDSRHQRKHRRNGPSVDSLLHAVLVGSKVWSHGTTELTNSHTSSSLHRGAASLDCNTSPSDRRSMSYGPSTRYTVPSCHHHQSIPGQPLANMRMTSAKYVRGDISVRPRMCARD
jgi:hypothetical protein